MARSPLFHAVRRALRMAVIANQAGAPPVSDLIGQREERRISRRAFLGTSAIAALTGPAILSSCASDGGKRHSGAGASSAASGARFARAPRVVIVGGGMAGLNASHHLRKAGVEAPIFEAAERAGGRIHTAKNLMGEGLTTELGAEFIDTNHEDMLALCQEFNLPLFDTTTDREDLINDAYFFGGRHYTEEQVVEAFRPLAARMAADLEPIGETVNYQEDGGARALDQLSISAYLDRIGASGWIRQLLEVAYITEYGLEANEQSCLNLLFMIDTEMAEGFRIFGDSDERFKIAGGNQRITDALAEESSQQLRLGRRLEALRELNGGGYRLSFSQKAGPASEVDADYVILTLPFTMLREVDLKLKDMPAVKRRAIAELGYGMNAKVFLGMRQPVWRGLGYAGTSYSDEAYQLLWDNSRGQEGSGAGLTVYTGGREGIACGKGTAEDQARRYLPGIERTFPGCEAAYSGKAARFHWPTHPLTKASYACYRPGQWTALSGAEQLSVGNVYFAGEHCSVDFQGYMNGAAETGRVAAEALADFFSRA